MVRLSLKSNRKHSSSRKNSHSIEGITGSSQTFIVEASSLIFFVLGDIGLQHLVSSLPCLANLSVLNLGCNGITHKGLRNLASSLSQDEKVMGLREKLPMRNRDDCTWNISSLERNLPRWSVEINSTRYKNGKSVTIKWNYSCATIRILYSSEEFRCCRIIP